MRKESDMLLLVMGLLYWTQTEGGCSGTTVSISGDDNVLPAGEGFKLSCEFTCLSPQHVAQLWRESIQGKVSIVNITSTLPNVILALSISSATKADTGYYSCMTQPPHTISPSVSIQISDNLTTSTLTTPSALQCDNSNSSAAGLQGQIWYWFLLGKTAFLLLSLASLALKYKKG